MENSFSVDNLEGVLGVMVPIIAIVGGLSLAFGIAYLRNKERMELISRGIDISAYNRNYYRGRRRSPLQSGLIAFGVGAGLLAAYIVCHLFLHNADHTVIYLGFVGVFVGVALMLGHTLEKKGGQDNQNKGV